MGRPRKETNGIFEKLPGSDVWWIRYKVAGVRHREKVGKRQDAIDTLAARKAERAAGTPFPKNMKKRGVKFKEIANDALDWYRNHGRKDFRNFNSRMQIILEDFAESVAAEMTPGDIDKWIGKHKWSPATKNRYRNVFGKSFKIAWADGKVTSNPAHLVELRPENNTRIRYLLDDEETRLRKVIERRFSMHLPAFEVALHTGMRKSEQFTLEWACVEFERTKVQLDETKNGSNREIPMNKTCLAAFRQLKSVRPHNGRVFQSIYGEDLNNPRKWFDAAVAEAEIVNFHWHDLRHTFISRLVMAGVDLRTVQELAGHKTIQMTMRYAHLAPEHNQAAIEKLDPNPGAKKSAKRPAPRLITWPWASSTHGRRRGPAQQTVTAPLPG
jgi:integrase